MKLAAYLRVSTQQQAEHGLGLPIQRAQIKAWATSEGHKIVAWHADEGVSGSNGLETRIGLYEALHAVEEGEAEGIVVYRLDRLARDLILQETLLARVWRANGVVLSTVDAEQDALSSSGDDPTRNLTRQILGAIAQYERALIVMRLRSGKLAKQVRGGYVGGSVPLGFQLAADGVLEPHAAERHAVAEMVQLRQRGLTYRAICDALEAGGHRPTRGARWYPATVRKVIERQSA